MSKTKNGIIWVVLGFSLLVQYTNCASYSDGLDAGSDLVTDSNTDTITSYEGIRITNGDTYMNCDEDHIQLGGTCNTADAYDNYLEARITHDRATVYWGAGSEQTDHLSISKCENGRFFAIIPKPNDPALSAAGSDYVEYQITLQIYASKDRVTYTGGEKSPVFNINVQKNAACY